jgi:hypothetical protein
MPQAYWEVYQRVYAVYIKIAIFRNTWTLLNVFDQSKFSTSILENKVRS